MSGVLRTARIFLNELPTDAAILKAYNATVSLIIISITIITIESGALIIIA